MARVEELLAERMSLRKSRDFGGADVLRDELRAIGVTVLDREMRWFVGARQGYRGDDGGRGPAAAERSAAAVAESRARGNGRAPFDPAQFGPNGHDYTQSIPNGDYGTELDEATLATVHSLLARQQVIRPPPPLPPFWLCPGSAPAPPLGVGAGGWRLWAARYYGARPDHCTPLPRVLERAASG